jgi:hypothetical protein
MKYLIALLFCFTLAAQTTVNNFTVKTNLTAQIINNSEVSITSFGAVGDGVTDNTTAIQAALDKASQIGATVKIPTGIFVTGPLVVKTNIVAIVGSQPNSEKFAAQTQSSLKLKNNALSSTILTWNTGACAGLGNIVIDGNKANQTSTDPLVVVGLETGSRDETGFYNFGIINGKGWGLKIRRNEVELKNGSVLFCDGGGVWFAGNDSGGYGSSDCTLMTFGSGFNGGDGILFDGPFAGAQRLFNVDTYFNQGDGIEFRGSTNGVGLITATQLQSNNNFQHNVYVNGYTTSLTFDSCIFYGANYNDNGLGLTNSAASGTYSDFYIDPSASGFSSGIVLSNCKMGINFGVVKAKLPKYSFDDSRTNSYYNGKGVVLSGNVLGLDSAANFTTSLAVSTNVYQFGIVTGNTRFDGTSLNNYFNLANINAGVLTAQDNVFLRTTGMTNPALFYQHQDGGLAIRLGPTASYKYFSFDSAGTASIPGAASFAGSITAAGALSVQDTVTVTNSSLGSFLMYLSGSGGFNVAANYSGSAKYFQMSGSDGSITIDGSLIARNLGYGVSIKEGSNAKMGTATLTAGSATVSTTAVAANSRIFLTSNTDGGTPGWLRVSARTAGTSFTITSSSATDTSTVAWIIFDPAP